MQFCASLCHMLLECCRFVFAVLFHIFRSLHFLQPTALHLLPLIFSISWSKMSVYGDANFIFVSASEQSTEKDTPYAFRLIKSFIFVWTHNYYHNWDLPSRLYSISFCESKLNFHVNLWGEYIKTIVLTFISLQIFEECHFHVKIQLQ